MLDIAQVVKDEASMTRSMTPGAAGADPLAQLDMGRQATTATSSSAPGETFCILSSSTVGAVGVAEGDLRFLSYRLATSAG